MRQMDFIESFSSSYSNLFIENTISGLIQSVLVLNSILGAWGEQADFPSVCSWQSPSFGTKQNSEEFLDYE